jgi:hypothetical protein
MALFKKYKMCLCVIVYCEGTWRGKLFRLSEEGPLSGAARNHANLLRSGSVPPLQRLLQEALLRASGGIIAAHPASAQSLHAGLKGVIGTYEGCKHRWEVRNPRA